MAHQFGLNSTAWSSSDLQLGSSPAPLTSFPSPSTFGNTLTVLSASTLPTFHFLHPPFHFTLIFAYFLIFPDFRFVLLPLLFSWILVFRAITFYGRGRKKCRRDFLTLSVLGWQKDVSLSLSFISYMRCVDLALSFSFIFCVNYINYSYFHFVNATSYLFFSFNFDFLFQ